MTEPQNMTYDEQMEVVAQALGFIDDATTDSDSHGLHRSYEGEFYWASNDGSRPWNPQDLAEDAMHLASVLGIDLHFDLKDDAGRPMVGATFTITQGVGDVYCLVGSDINASTRKVIFNAAVLVGTDNIAGLEIPDGGLAQPSWTESQIAAACAAAGISDSQRAALVDQLGEVRPQRLRGRDTPTG